nr:uncharacterized protein LOC109403026 isoform X2 [Aedes albopictus]
MRRYVFTNKLFSYLYKRLFFLAIIEKQQPVSGSASSNISAIKAPSQQAQDFKRPQASTSASTSFTSSVAPEAPPVVIEIDPVLLNTQSMNRSDVVQYQTFPEASHFEGESLTATNLSDHKLYEAHAINQSSVLFEEQPERDTVGPLNETVTDIDALIRQAVFDSVNEVVPVAIDSYLGKAIEKAVEQAVSKVVERAVDQAVAKAVDKCFESNFARLAAMFEVMDKDKAKSSSTNDEVMIEKRTLIDSEEDVDQLNIDLRDDVLQSKFLEYFSRIIVPNSFAGKGDNACYIIADCLITRQFWNKFTWTGVNRGEKCKRGFREFGNVTELILSIVQIGDPSYTRKDLEKFCKTRLFRHSKTRAKSKKIRKSSCRIKQGVVKKIGGSNIQDGDLVQDEIIDATNAETNSGTDDASEVDEERASTSSEISEEDRNNHEPMDSDDSSE